MHIGVLGPPKNMVEGRVLLTPRQAGLLEAAGCRVSVEVCAGDRAGFADADYAAEGANVAHRNRILQECDLLLTVAPPAPDEILTMPSGALLLGFLHSGAAGRQSVEAAKQRNIVPIGLERIQQQGRFPFRERMAEVAGAISMQLAARLLESGPGRGVLLGGVGGVPPAAVVVVGAGALGRAATRAFAGVGASVLVMDHDWRALEQVETLGLGRVQTMLAGRSEIADAASWADVLVCAVRVPQGPPPKLVSPLGGKVGAVWLDLSIDEGGCIEGAKPVYSADEAYMMEGITLCPVPNLASWAARTASRVASGLLFPSLLRAAESGKPLLESDPWLATGI